MRNALAKKKDELLTNYAIKSERVHTINQLLKAYTMFEKDDEYVVIDGQVKIVDEQTGRIMEGRRYSDGLHQAIEAKEGVKVEAATDLCNDYAAELLPYVSQAVRYDRYCRNGSRRTLGHLQTGCSRYPDQPPDCPQRYERPRLQDQTRKNIKPLSEKSKMVAGRTSCPGGYYFVEISKC